MLLEAWHGGDVPLVSPFPCLCWSFAIPQVFSQEGKCESISCLDTDLKVEFQRPLDCPPTPLENQPASWVVPLLEQNGLP